MQRRLAWVFALFITLQPAAFGIFGVGDVVYDPAVYAQAVQQYAQMVQQYNQLVRTYQSVENQYQQLLWMSKQLPQETLARYRALAAPLKTFAASDDVGNLSAMILAMNTGTGVDGAFAGSINKLGVQQALSALDQELHDRLKTAYSDVELTDGSIRSAVETVGELRARSVSFEAAIAQLEADSLSSDNRLNTELAVLNKINAADVLALRNARDTNGLLTTLADAQIVAVKQQRDAQTQAVNNRIAFLNDGKALLDAQAAGASTALSEWRMP